MNLITFITLYITIRASKAFEEFNLNQKNVTTINCFECYDCNQAAYSTRMVECSSPDCCYTAHVKRYNEGGLYVIKGCGRSDFKGGATACMNIHQDYIKRYPLGSVIECITCDNADGCNESPTTNIGEWVMCYQCRNCNKISASTSRVICRFGTCCYVALVKDEVSDMVFAIRGCASLNNACVDTCNQVKRQHLLEHVNGSLHYCMSCDIGDGDGCNQNSYTPHPVGICYDCYNCNRVVSTTPTTHCTGCCYVAIVNVDDDIFAVRGCVDNCLHVCMNITYGNNMFCMGCNGDRCNANNYKPDDSIMMKLDDVINCFSCDNCTDIKMNTPKINCASNCCYLKIIQGISQRGCVANLTGSCDLYCGMQSDVICDTCSSDKCNIRRIKKSVDGGHSIYKRSSVVNCYECFGCYTVSDAMHSTVPCPDQCCLMIWWTEHQASTMIRMCVKLDGKRCQDYCSYSDGVIKTQDPNGIVHYCEDCSIDKCNYIEVYQTNIIPNSLTPINCFNKKCNRNETCYSGCCYAADFKKCGKLNTVRGCATILPGRSCSKYCASVEEEFKEAGTLEKCTVCTTDMCNIDKSSLIKKCPPVGNKEEEDTTKHNEIIQCYTCKNCATVSDNTILSKCMSKCCVTFVINVNGVSCSKRKCVNLKRVPCAQYCSYLRATRKIGFCMVCNYDRCNGIDVRNETEKPKCTTNRQHTPIKCYECRNCNQITNLCKICESGCCFTTILKYDNLTVVLKRGCMRIIPGRTCRCFCKDVETNHKASNPIGSRDFYCRTCVRSKCNNWDLNVEAALGSRVKFSRVPNSNLHANPKVRSSQIRCYICNDNCNRITTNTRCVMCEEGCCYSSILVHDNGMVVKNRGCVQIIPGRTCRQYCLAVRKEHTASNPMRSKDFYCRTCVRSRCNNRDLNLESEPALHPRVELAADPSTIYSPSCYNCIGCNNITSTNETFETIDCPDNCCFTAVWTEFGVTLVARLCAFLQAKRCSNFCGYLTRRVLTNDEAGVLHHCRTCCTPNCNSKPVPVHRKTEGRSINCYECENCDETTNTTLTVSCPTGCCYAELKYTNDGTRLTSRHCAKLFPGVICRTFCAHSKQLHLRPHPRGSFIYCQGCRTELCNQQLLNTDETGVPNKEDYKIKCYDCDNCYSIVNETSKLCDTGCCLTAKWTQFNDTQIRRDCILPDETPCSHYCENLNRTIRFSDPSSILHNCDVCRNSDCNRLKAENPHDLTIRQFSCYQCTGCGELLLDSTTVPCYSYCCYTTVEQPTDTDAVAIRGCAGLYPGSSCLNYCAKRKEADSFHNRTTQHCKECPDDRCNHDNVEEFVLKYTTTHSTIK